MHRSTLTQKFVTKRKPICAIIGWHRIEGERHRGIRISWDGFRRSAKVGHGILATSIYKLMFMIGTWWKNGIARTNVWRPWSFHDHLGIRFPFSLYKHYPDSIPLWISKIAEDADFTLFSLVLFKKVRDDFAQKCRENKYEAQLPPHHLWLMFGLNRFILRDFTFDERSLGKQREELDAADITERELWVCGTWNAAALAKLNSVATHSI